MRLNTVEFLLHEGWEAAVRNGVVTLAAISNTAVALLILGALVLFGMNVEHMAALQTEAAVITVELAKDADAAAVEAALWRIDPPVASIRFVGKDEALRQIMERLGILPEARDMLGENILPDGFHIKTVDPQDIPEVAREVERIEGVAMVRYAQQVTEKLLTLARGIRLSGIIIGIVMGLATLVVISTTIRLTTYARRQEIRIMQLVGATKWFIRIPFVIEGILDGLAGGAIAAAILLPIYSYAQEYISENLAFINLIYSTQALVLFALGVVLCGVVFGAVGSLMGLHRYLRQV